MTEHADRRVSTGSLPAASVVGQLLDEAHQRFGAHLSSRLGLDLFASAVHDRSF